MRDRFHVMAMAIIAASFAAVMISGFDATAQVRQRLPRVGEIAFGTLFEDARETSDSRIGLSYTTADQRVLKTLAQTRVSLWGTEFNLTYLFGKDDRLTRVFGSVVRAMDLDRGSCLERGADVFAATVRDYGSPDTDRRSDNEREWRFSFADGRWIRLKYQYGGVLGACNIIVDSVTPEGKNDHS